MDINATIVSALSLAVAGAGTVLASSRAKEALAESRKSAASALWSGVQKAVQRTAQWSPSTPFRTAFLSALTQSHAVLPA